MARIVRKVDFRIVRATSWRVLFMSAYCSTDRLLFEPQKTLLDCDASDKIHRYLIFRKERPLERPTIFPGTKLFDVFRKERPGRFADALYMVDALRTLSATLSTWWGRFFPRKFCEKSLFSAKNTHFSKKTRIFASKSGIFRSFSAKLCHFFSKI